MVVLLPVNIFCFCLIASTPEESRENKKDKEGDKAAEENKQKAKGSKPLMPTSTILRLLAELVRSYVGIATLIANYNYTVGQSELIKEVRSARKDWLPGMSGMSGKLRCLSSLDGMNSEFDENAEGSGGIAEEGCLDFLNFYSVEWLLIFSNVLSGL